MDPLTHTLFGGVLAETGLKRRLKEHSGWAMATLMIGANLPDVDVVSYFWGSDVALGFRRGWTHGVLALLVLPVLLTLLASAAQRWRSRRGRAGPPIDGRQLLLLSTIAVWSHPLLDWLNTYGVRVLMPFSGEWFYGDALFIIDPWVWLVLGGALFLVHSASGRALAAWSAVAALLTTVMMAGVGPHGWARFVWLGALVTLIVMRFRVGPLSADRARLLARSALLLTVLYAGGMATLTAWTTAQVEAQVVAGALGDDARLDGPLMVGPDRIDSLRRLVVAPVADGYHFGSYHPLRQPALIFDLQRSRLVAPDVAPDVARERVDEAREAHCVHGLVNWLRYPFYEVDAADDGSPTTVYLLDARYTRGRTRGFGGGVVTLSPEGASCDASPP